MDCIWYCKAGRNSTHSRWKVLWSGGVRETGRTLNVNRVEAATIMRSCALAVETAAGNDGRRWVLLIPGTCGEFLNYERSNCSFWGVASGSAARLGLYFENLKWYQNLKKFQEIVIEDCPCNYGRYLIVTGKKGKFSSIALLCEKTWRLEPQI